MSSIIDQDIIDVASTTFEVRFQEIFENDDATPGIAERISERVPTDSEINEVDVLGAIPVLRQWQGAKQFQTQRAYSQSVTLRTYEASFSLPRKKVRYDRTGLIGRRVSRFMSRNQYWAESILFTELVTASGAGPTGYDGVSLINAAHPDGPGATTQSNTNTTALAISSLDSAIITMQSLRDENSENLGVSPDLLVVGPKLRKDAMEFTGSTRLQLVDAAGITDPTAAGVASSAVPNLFVGGMLDVLVWPRLVGTQDDYWYLFDTTLGAPAMLLYEGRAVESIEQTDMAGEFRFINDKLRWSLESDHVPAAGAWQTVHGGIL